jgi:zinc transport system substrate-binding protein
MGRAARAAVWSVNLILVAALTGCDGATTEASRDGGQSAIRVTTGIAPHAWLVRQIGGDRVDVHVLVQAGESPHTYQPSDAQISRVVASQLFFRTGMPFERGPWLEAIHAGGRGPRMVDLREGIRLRTMEVACDHDHAHDHDHGHHHEAPDPHIWLSPRLLITQAATIAAALGDVAPEHADVFAANLDAFTQAAQQTHTRIADMLAPHAGRRFYIFHPAWGYFADDYLLTQVAVEIDGKEPAEHELTQLQRQARADGARVVFVQPQIAGRAARGLAAAIDGRVETLDPLADDVLANLLHAAAALTAAFSEAQPAAQPAAQPGGQPAADARHEHAHE